MTSDREAFDNISNPIPDSHEAFATMWGGRLDQYQARVEGLKVQAQEQNLPLDRALNEYLVAIRECVDTAQSNSAELEELSNRCEQQWREFERLFREAEKQLGTSGQTGTGEDTTCRSHGGQVGHQNTGECPP